MRYSQALPDRRGVISEPQLVYPAWADRDRFVLINDHGSMLITACCASG